MKAVVLVGGQGTRLRPLTCNTPKPLLPVANRPFLEHIIRLLKRHGIDDIILAIQYLSDTFEQHYGDGSSLGVHLTYLSEDTPLGTAGAVKNVERHLDGTFVVFNGDILTDLDLTAMLAFHRERGSRLTIALTPVDDPTAYGVVDLDEGQRIRRFLEKPRWEDVTSNLINAGTYVIEPEVFRYVPPNEPYMFERGLFPVLLQTEDPMYGFPSDAYWIDIGTPQKYLDAHQDLLLGRVASDFAGREHAPGVWLGEGTRVDPTAKINGPVVIGAGCDIGANARVSGPAVVGDRCEIGPHAALEGSVLWERVRLEARVAVRRCVIARDTVVGEETAMDGGAVIADGCTIGAGNRLEHGIRLWPGVHLPARAISF